LNGQQGHGNRLRRPASTAHEDEAHLSATVWMPDVERCQAKSAVSSPAREPAPLALCVPGLSLVQAAARHSARREHVRVQSDGQPLKLLSISKPDRRATLRVGNEHVMRPGPSSSGGALTDFANRGSCDSDELRKSSSTPRQPASSSSLD
jgi:hypothetical protein